MPQFKPQESTGNCLLAIGLSVGLFALAACSDSQPLSPVEIEKANVAYQSCLICHSAQEMQRGPIIDGLPAWYVEGQLRKFRAGVRGEKPGNRSEYLMASARDRIGDDKQIALLARYIESLPPQKRHPVIRGEAAKGKILYMRCIACHGDRGQGNQLLKSPPLNIQEDWYLLDQLRKYAKGQRGYHADDIEGQQMAVAIAGLEDQDFKDLVAYLQTFEP